MRSLATILSAAMLLVLAALPVQAQRGGCDTMEDVTIDQLNAVPQENIDALNALGANATAEEIHNLLTNEWDNPRRPDGAPFRCVTVEGVVISDPRYSGLASWNANAGMPGRIHFFIRDVAAETQGPAGMTIMVVDGTLSGASLPLRPGDVIELEGFLDIFGNPPERAWQLTPLDGEAIEVIDLVDPNQEWLQPVLVGTDDINMVVAEVGGEPVVQARWSNWNALNGQYVRVEGAEITNSDQNEGTGRPNWAFASVGEDERVASRDLSLRYRNDRHGSYPPPPAFFTRPADDPFIAPPPGAIVDVQGFLAFGPFDAFQIGQPERAKFFISPITDDDLVLDISPPVIAVEPLTEVPTGDFDVFAIVQPGGGDPIVSVTLEYEFTSGASGSVSMGVAPGDNRFVGTIPTTPDEDGAFVSYFVTAEDAGGLQNSSSPRSTRVLFGGITQIEHIQRTMDGGRGPSPFAGISTDMNIQAVVMTPPDISGIISIQDDPDLEPWTGVIVASTEDLLATLQLGDRVTITHAAIEEFFQLTRLQVSLEDIEVTAPGEPYPYVSGLPTGLFAQSDEVAERYEGMALRFDNVTITDADAGFGEWRFSSDGTAPNAILGDDESDVVPGGFMLFKDGDELEFIQGVWTFTFSNYKLWPQTLDDIGFKVSSDPGATPQAITLDGAYPNPLASRAAIAYELAQSGHVRLEVFDLTGRRVAVLFDGEQAAGPQEVELNAAAMASGMYIVRLAADGEVQTTRIVVTR